MNHPLLTEIQLGRPIKDVAESLLEEASKENEVHNLDADDIEKVIKELIRVNNKNIRWHVCEGYESCSVLVLDKKFQDDLFFDYWDDEGWARDDEAHEDCDFLNEVTKKLFAVEDKPQKAKVTQTDFKKKKGKVCPYCNSTKVTSIGVLSTYMKKIQKGLMGDWMANREMACIKCNAEWTEEYKLTISKYS
jgi:hypothetical protein